MARVTIEDCLEKVENRFKLVLLASKRASQIGKGASPLVARDDDKPVVLALREIADGVMNEQLIEGADNSTVFANSEEKELI